jgi:beta-glucosidase/6-phospho-beta-glucosidase/beta-galactosidase
MSKSEVSKSEGFSFPRTFQFGMATAPAHAEDNLHDVWLDFAKKGKIAAFTNTPNPEQRLLFWSRPEIELNAVQKLGVSSIRLGLDWGRLVSEKCAKSDAECEVLEPTALANYIKILQLAKDRKLQIFLGLFHHSMPVWALSAGGFSNADIARKFVLFVKSITPHVASLVDDYIVFNEASAFVFMTHMQGLWPGGKAGGIPSLLKIGPFEGKGSKAFSNIKKAYKESYQIIHKLDTQLAHSGSWSSAPARVGVAHITLEGKDLSPQKLSISAAMESFPYLLVDDIVSELDFLGINFYGYEYFTPIGALAFKPDREYSDSGRAITPKGLKNTLVTFHKRYNQTEKFQALRNKKVLPLFVTENGIADESDTLRPSYIIEHLAAINAALKENVPVKGYFLWTLSDNWEWLDGYCPKFGLMQVDRTKLSLPESRIPRASFSLFQKIATSHSISHEMRAKAWNKVALSFVKKRTFCRGEDQKSSLDLPRTGIYNKVDWRFDNTAADE